MIELSNAPSPKGFGVYFINRGDEKWTKVEVMPTLDEAKDLMVGFQRVMKEKFNRPPYCMAISEGHTEDFVLRDEMKAVTGRHS